MKAVLSKASMDPEEIGARWTALARAGLSDFYTVEEYEVSTDVQQSLVNAITEIENEMVYNHAFMVRAWDVLGTSEEDRGKELLEEERNNRHRKLSILRHQMALEENPAVSLIPGPKVKKQRVVLDLVKAESLGMLDLIKAIVPTEYGTKVELRSPDAALDNLAKWRGMLVTKVDVTSGGEQLPAPAILAVLSTDVKLAIIEARRKARAQEGAPGE